MCQFMHKKFLYFLFLISIHCVPTLQSLHGRFTRDITSYELTVPVRVNPDGELVSFNLPAYYKHDFSKARWKREDPERELHYKVVIAGVDHHLELRPNHGFISPNLVVENYRGSSVPVADRIMRRAKNMQCHYVGKVRGHATSNVALSLCDGVAGYISGDHGNYFVEPLAEYGPNDNGEHLHIVYKRDIGKEADAFEMHSQCGTRNWEEGWRESFVEMYKRQGSTNSSKSSLHSFPRYMEILVVADKKFLDYHKDIDYENYILTIMNMVSNFYHDSSVGNDLNVVVVRIIYIEKEETYTDLKINRNAEDTLDNFCKWQQTINPADVQNPQHHDIAVLLTRHDICSDNMTECNLLGLAFVAGVCRPSKCCAINEDNGLLLGVVVAHEVGHVMGCRHDELEKTGCAPKASDGFYHIMSPYVHISATKWSNCSRRFITEIIENNMGECLNDEPPESIHQLNDMLPGSVYDGNFQCNQDFPGKSVCHSSDDTFCEMLYCRTKPTSCSSKGSPPADGTKCGENKWCYNNKCETMGSRPKAVNGGWGKWGRWSKCTRTCGGGVHYRVRRCNNPKPTNRGRFCFGERKQVKICNKNPCPLDTKSFRTIQCEAFNDKPHKGKLHKWKPYFDKIQDCSLYCQYDYTYAKKAPRVIDGTSCKPGTKNRCIFGICRKVGCDYIIDSDAIEDDCGICKGDGTMCKVHDQVYKRFPGGGYKPVVTIPKGSKKIYITELAASANNIAISAADGKTFFLNGNYKENDNGFYDIGGAPGIYDHPYPDKESLYIAGPLQQDIIFHVVFYKKLNPGFRYKYAELSPQPLYKPVYRWEFLEFSDCSARCGGGTETADPQCIEEKSGEVDNSFCQSIPKPKPRLQKCNIHPCKTEWRPSKWNTCNACKGHSGFKTRTVECVRDAPKDGDEDAVVDDKLCRTLKPASKKLCCSNKPCSTAPKPKTGYDRQSSKLWYQINSHTLDPTIFSNFKRELRTKKKRDGAPENLKNSCKKCDLPVKNKTEENPRANLKRCGSCNKTEGTFMSRTFPEHHRKRYRDYAMAEMHRRSLKRRSRKLDDKQHRNETNEIISDQVPLEQNQVIEVPIKSSHKDANVSDLAFETAGDKIVDALDTCHTVVYTGKSAIDELNRLNATANVTDTVEDKLGFFRF